MQLTLNEISNTPALGFDPLRALCHELHVLRANSSDLPAKGNAFLGGTYGSASQQCLFLEYHQLCLGDRWREWGLWSLEKALGGYHSTFQYLKKAHEIAGEGLFTRAWSDRARGNTFKVKEDRFSWDIRKKYFTVRLVALLL